MKVRKVYYVVSLSFALSGFLSISGPFVCKTLIEDPHTIRKKYRNVIEEYLEVIYKIRTSTIENIFTSGT